MFEEVVYSPDNKEHSPFLSIKGNITLYSDDKLIDKVNLEEVESISNQTFGQLMHDSFAQDKGLIVGRVQTRDRIQSHKCFYHYFYAPNLVKLLFKTPFVFTEETLISRYHQTMPMTVKNPMTNEIIVGEVEFYLVKKDQQANQNASQQQQDQSHGHNVIHGNVVQGEEYQLTATFIGTDFNYATSNQFRQIFLDYSLETEHIKMQLGPEINSKLRNNPEFTTFANHLMRIQQNNLGPRVFFNQITLRKKNVCFHGAVLAFFAIAAITTFILGCMGLQALSTTEKEEDLKMSFDIFTYTLPFVAFILDHSTKRIKNLQEKSIYILLKLVFIIYYLGAYVLSLQSSSGGSSKQYYIISNVNFLAYPFLAAGYQFLLRKKYLQ